MTSPFRDASRIVESGLVCPRCGQINARGQSPAVELDPKAWTAFCTTCAHAGPAVEFLSRETVIGATEPCHERPETSQESTQNNGSKEDAERAPQAKV